MKEVDVIKTYFETMKKQPLQSCDKEQLVDITSIRVNKSESKEKRLFDFIRRIKNPYLFKVGDVAVHVVFNDDGPTFQEQFENLIESNLGK